MTSNCAIGSVLSQMGDLGFLQWIDPYEWTERDPKARNHAIQNENRLFKRILGRTDLRRDKHVFVEAYHQTNTIKTVRIPERNPQILVRPRLRIEGVYYWKHVGDARWKYADDLDYWPTHRTRRLENWTIYSM
jgi:hypothetical protein